MKKVVPKLLILFFLLLCLAVLYGCEKKTVPGAPTDVSATAGDARAIVTFTAPVDNGGSPKIRYTVTSSPGDFTGTGTASPVTVTDLANWTVTGYTFTVVATNINGNSASSSPSNSVIPGTVINPTTGKIWMDRNLGSSQVNQVAISSTDAASFGDLYQWGRGSDGHQGRASGTTTTLSSSDTPGHRNFILVPNSPWDWRSPQNNNLWHGVSGVNNPCPTGYRLPTDAEWNAERVSWSTNNAAGAYDSPLKLPLAGARSNSNGVVFLVGTWGLYCSSTVSGAYSRYLSFTSSSADTYTYNRAAGYSVRCLMD